MTEKYKAKDMSATFSSFHMEADRCSSGMQIFITGIIGIGSYSDYESELKSHGGRIKITGSRLKLCILENNTLEIKGRVEGIFFSYGKG